MGTSYGHKVEVLRKTALKFADMGIPIVPAKQKRIIINGWSKLTSDQVFDKKYNRYWSEATGIGLICGKSSGVIGVDIDLLLSSCDKSLYKSITDKLPPILSGKAGNPDKRPTQFFRYNGESGRKFQYIHVEILSDGNQTIIPPSAHPDFKKEYEWVGTPLHEMDIDDLPTLPENFIPFLEQLNEKHKPQKGKPDTTIVKKKGRCHSGSHNKLSKLAVALFHDNYPFDRLVTRMIEEDKKLNHDADKLYFECSSRKWKHKSIEENAKDFVEEIFNNYGPGGKNESKEKTSKTSKTSSTKTTEKEQIGFYFRYRILKNDGGVKIVDIPQYELMANHCFDEKNKAFDDTESIKFDGKKWSWLSKTEFNNYIFEQNKSVLQPAHLDGFAKMIKSKCFINALGIKHPDGLINVNNGVIDVVSGNLLPHSHEYLFKYCAPVDFDKSAECPQWENFLFQVFNGNVELCDLVQRLFGYILIGGRPFLHRAFVLYGNGRNGKSTFLDVLRAVIGSDAYSTVSMAKLDKEFSLVNIDGKLANIVEETPNDEINAEVFKTLVGGGEVQAAHKGFDEYSFRCNARFVFACNDMPIFKDKSVGLEERLVFIPFERYFEEHERDTKMTEKLLTELPGILNWALAGVRLITKDPTIPDYAVLRQSKETYRVETNPLYAWFLEAVDVRVDGDNITVNDAYRIYSRAILENGGKPFSKDRFAKQFRKHLESECKIKNIYYDKNLRDSVGNNRIFNVFKWRVTGLTAVDSTLVNPVSVKKYWDLE